MWGELLIWRQVVMTLQQAEEPCGLRRGITIRGASHGGTASREASHGGTASRGWGCHEVPSPQAAIRVLGKEAGGESNAG